MEDVDNMNIDGSDGINWKRVIDMDFTESMVNIKISPQMRTGIYV
jgi:hypothetical protein